MKALSDIVIRNALPKDKVYRLNDSNKLYLQVFPDGTKAWRVRLFRNNKETMLSLGNYPDVKLRDARLRRDEINRQLANGIDPSEEKKRQAELDRKKEETFAHVADLWLESMARTWSGRHFIKTRARVESYLNSRIGLMPVREIQPGHVLPVLRAIEKQKKFTTAHIIFGLCSQIMRYAVGNQFIDSNPCRDLEGALAPAPVKHFAALTTPVEVGKFLLDIDTFAGTAVVHCALRLSPYLFQRPTEIREAEWEEIDWTSQEWRIPAIRMKMDEHHIVPLSRQALAIFKELKEMTGHGKYCFPSVRRSAICMSDGTVRAAIRRMGYSNEEMTPHGFRSTASTLLNELGFNGDFIERQLAHSPRDKVRASYNRASYLKERRKMMQAWADYLDELRERARSEEKRLYIDNILK